MLLALVMLASAAPAPLLRVVGAPKPLALTAADLAAMPRAMAKLTTHGATHQCEGVWLRDVLAGAGAPAGQAVQGPALTTAVMAQAQDGYQILFSLGEIDAALGNGRLLVADRCDGKPLPDADGPTIASISPALIRRLTLRSTAAFIPGGT